MLEVVINLTAVVLRHDEICVHAIITESVIKLHGSSSEAIF